MAQVEKVSNQVPTKPGCVGIHMALASYYSKMKDIVKAEEYLDNALKLDPHNNEVLWLQAKVRKDKQLEQQTQRCKEKFSSPKQEKLKMKDPIKVDQCDYSSLDAKEFLVKYALAGTPVIITGLLKYITTEPWSLQYIKKVIGHKTVPTQKQPKQSTGSQTVESVVNSLHNDKKTSCHPEWCLQSFAPELAADLMIPRYAANDFLQRTEPDTMHRNTWPCLSIEPAGRVKPMCVEPLGFNSWMALFEGRKRLTFVRKENLPCLYPYCDDDLNIIFNADISKPDLKDFPLLTTITPLECVLEPGEILFIPHGMPYCIETLDDSLSVSGKYIDLSNYQSILEELQVVGISDPKALNLYTQLSSETFPTNMYSRQKDLNWEEFKKWPRENYVDYDINLKDCS